MVGVVRVRCEETSEYRKKTLVHHVAYFQFCSRCSGNCASMTARQGPPKLVATCNSTHGISLAVLNNASWFSFHGSDIEISVFHGPDIETSIFLIGKRVANKTHTALHSSIQEKANRYHVFTSCHTLAVIRFTLPNPVAVADR